MRSSSSGRLPSPVHLIFLAPWQNSCQEFCRYPAGALYSCQECSRIWPTDLDSEFPRGATFFFRLTIIYPWLDFGLPPRCPQVVWCHWGEIQPFSATLAQDGLAECDQTGKNLLKYSAVVGNWTRASGGLTVSFSTELSWLICDIGRLYSCTRVLHRRGDSMCEHHLFNVGSRNRWGYRKFMAFGARTGNRTSDLWFKH